jgi:hypothetical protein
LRFRDPQSTGQLVRYHDDRSCEIDGRKRAHRLGVGLRDESVAGIHARDLGRLADLWKPGKVRVSGGNLSKAAQNTSKVFAMLTRVVAHFRCDSAFRQSKECGRH